MFVCTTGQIETTTKGGKQWYRLRLNLVDENARQRKDRYKNKYLDTGLLVGGRTGRLRNDKLAAEMLTQAIREYTPVGSDMSFDNYCRYWIEEIKKDHSIAVTTREGYEYKIGYVIRFFDGKDIPLREITTSDLKALQNSLYEVGKTSTVQRKEKGLCERTIRDIMILTKQVFKYAIDNGHLIGANPTASLKLPKKRKTVDDLPYISEDELPVFKQALQENCDGHAILERAFLVALFYGLRREEICGLRWQAIRNGDIHIEHTVTKLRTLVAKDDTKTDASHRTCAILPEIQAIFDEIKAEQEKNRELFGNTYHDSDYIFTWEDGRPFAPDYLTKKFKKIIQGSSLDQRLHLHDLRVSCVSILISKGVNIKDVQKWVGHADINTTMQIYARTSRKRQYETGQVMANVLF